MNNLPTSVVPLNKWDLGHNSDGHEGNQQEHKSVLHFVIASSLHYALDKNDFTEKYTLNLYSTTYNFEVPYFSLFVQLNDRRHVLGNENFSMQIKLLDI